VRCRGRAVLTQPHSFSLSHRVVAKGIFAHKLRTLQDFQRLRKLSRPLAAVPTFCHFTCRRYCKSQSGILALRGHAQALCTDGRHFDCAT
jgi:hypothetical protein